MNEEKSNKTWKDFQFRLCIPFLRFSQTHCFEIHAPHYPSGVFGSCDVKLEKVCGRINPVLFICLFCKLVL